MPNSNYNSGANFERHFMREMEKDGWKCLRSAGSHSMLDVILIPTTKSKEQKVIGCQLKTYSNLQPKPSKEFTDLDINIEKWWVTKKKYSRILTIEKVERPSEVVVPCSDATIATGLRPTY